MHICFVIPGDIDTPTGGYRYDRRIIGEWRKAGLCVTLVSLLGSYPVPDNKARAEALTVIRALPACDMVIFDGLAGGCSPELLEVAAERHPVAALIHHPLALENGLTAEQSKSFKNLEGQGLSFVKAVFTTSEATSTTVHQLFGFQKEAIHAVLPGVERGPLSLQPSLDANSCLRFLSVGSITKRKGHDVLLSAFGGLKQYQWTLDIVGPCDFDPKLFESLKKQRDELGLSKRVSFLGALSDDDLNLAYLAADIFVLASRYEGYGMAYAEAIVRGLPVIATTAGAVPDTVPRSCGLLVPPDDESALRQAALDIMCTPALRAEMRAGAIAAEPGFPTWEKSARRFSDFLETIK